MVAAVAAGAFAAAAAGSTLQSLGADSDANVTPLATSRDASAAFGVGGDTKASAPELLPVALSSDASAEVQKLDDSASVTNARVEREAAEKRKKEEEAKRPKIVNPCPAARFTSGFGARWGASHNGIDLAAPIGTPIYSVADGTVIEAGSASGFGLWVRVQMDDGTIHVYGHMNSFSVRAGQKVKAGEQIAEVGNRGESTGPHLHFEVWTAGGKKIDPSPWLRERGVKI
ncbi:M23 family metallopeptidase [Saccharothrix sp. AJ9571]|nr:M23 family metallopeptidase [Saccharothrix sp. AJ9571]